MTDLDRMILAARQIGEVVGEDLLVRISINPPNELWYGDESLVAIDALSIIRDRVWEAVQGYLGEFDWTQYGIELWTADDYLGRFPDLPSAVAAIHKHWKESK